jgi:hypothetical protein
VRLAAVGRCPGEQQALAVITDTTAGWGADSVGTALRMVAADPVCPAVGAAIKTSSDALQLATIAGAPLILAAEAASAAPSGLSTSEGASEGASQTETASGAPTASVTPTSPSPPATVGDGAAPGGAGGSAYLSGP